MHNLAAKCEARVAKAARTWHNLHTIQPSKPIETGNDVCTVKALKPVARLPESMSYTLMNDPYIPVNVQDFLHGMIRHAR